MLFRSDTQWVFDVFLPQAAETSCQKIFFIIDDNNTLKEELEGQSAELGKPFDVHYCFGLDDIKQILTKQFAFTGQIPVFGANKLEIYLWLPNKQQQLVPNPDFAG